MIMKILIVGAGLSGATIARVLADSGYQVNIIDRRNHVAGNAYDFINHIGIRVHKYGPHLFHTSDDKVVGFLSRFTEWNEYAHKVKAQLGNGKLVTLPVNRETAEIVGPDKIIDVFFRPYTKKMWGIDLEDIDPEVYGRISIRDDLNDLYFPNDKFQALPVHGYASMVNSMLDHANIKISLNTEFDKNMEYDFDHVFNSMPIDEYFDFKIGQLPYRSIKFHHYDLPIPGILPVATVNFTHDNKFTRVTEWKKLPGHGENSAWTSVTVEEPCDFSENNYERYYPVKDVLGHNRQKYAQYLSMTKKNMTFIGRCGLYAYLDMHQAVSSALSISNKFLLAKI